MGDLTLALVTTRAEPVGGPLGVEDDELECCLAETLHVRPVEMPLGPPEEAPTHGLKGLQRRWERLGR